MRNLRSFFILSIDKVLFLLGILALGSLTPVEAQEVPRPSLARAYTQSIAPTFYNIKAGPVLFRVDASLRSAYVDNVNLSNGKSTPIESDEIFSPALGIDALWTLTPLNTLQVHTTVGYTKYISHPKLDSALIAPDSAISFNIYTGDFKINLHEQFSYQQDPITQGSVSNVEKFGRFTNDAGVNVLWDANDLIATLGYDHSDFITTGAVSSSGQNVDVGSLSYDIDEVTASTLFQFLSNLGIGLEATASYVRYRSDAQDDSTRASIGPFLEFQLSRYTKIAASGGYQGTFSAGSGSSSPSNAATNGIARNGSGQGSSYYADISIANRFNRYITDRLEFGHESQVGILSAQTETSFVRLSTDVQIAPQLAISAGFNFEDTDDSGAFNQQLGGTSSSHYQFITFTIGTNYQITKKLTASFTYNYAQRIAGSSASTDAFNPGYTQNRFELALSYQF